MVRSSALVCSDSMDKIKEQSGGESDGEIIVRTKGSSFPPLKENRDFLVRAVCPACQVAEG